ncbi:MAG: YdiU family protein [Rhodospirillaceae bacterium]|nr:YdiU family protein [Rhodospirillaceae bacterium]
MPPGDLTFGFDNSYRRLPERFHARLPPRSAPAPKLIAFNRALATELGLDAEALEPHAAEIFSGNRLPADAEPLAAAYAGHQFGHFVPQLGDGRALLLGEVIDRHGQRRDIQLKGSGQTPFSRNGDGKAALGPVLREYIVSEAMHALGIPTTRSLAAVSTGEDVFRDGRLPGAVLTRVAVSHIRVGTFQYFAARRDTEAVKQLADHVIARHYPALAQSAQPAPDLLAAVAERQAHLIARWMHVGFIHGVMNTDNMTISGETIDYGPCAFMDAYDPMQVFSSIDRNGRYAFANQPPIAQWNLARLAETLLPLMGDDVQAAIPRATAIIEGFGSIFDAAWQRGMRAKIGLSPDEADQEGADAALIEALLDAMHEGQADYTLTFRRLSDLADKPDDLGALEAFRSLFANTRAVDAWLPRWRERIARDRRPAETRAAAMRAVNPAFIPRNHRIEQAIAAAVGQGDFTPFETLVKVLARPFDDQSEHAAYMTPPLDSERVTETFCGT